MNEKTNSKTYDFSNKSIDKLNLKMYWTQYEEQMESKGEESEYRE